MWQSRVENEHYSGLAKIKLNTYSRSKASSTWILIGSAQARPRDELQTAKHRPFTRCSQLIFATSAKKRTRKIEAKSV